MHAGYQKANCFGQGIAAYAAAFRAGASHPVRVAERICAELQEGQSWQPKQCYLVAFNEAVLMQQAEDSAARQGRQLLAVRGTVAAKPALDSKCPH